MAKTSLLLTEFRKVQTLAEIANVSIAPHSPYFDPCFLATLQLIACDPGIEAIERFYVDLEECLYGDAILPVGGKIMLPQGPGLGLDPDPEVIERLRTDR